MYRRFFIWGWGGVRSIIERGTYKSSACRGYLKSYDYRIHKEVTANREDRRGLSPGYCNPKSSEREKKISKGDWEEQQRRRQSIRVEGLDI